MLEGLKVVELATHIAAPGAAGLLAQWGADVIKIEPPAGDPIRRGFEALSPSTVSPVFEMDNRGKRSVALDIRQPADRDHALGLIRAADVFVTSTRPAGLRRAGLDWDSAHAANPRLIYASVTGYGSRGPDAALPGYDVAAFWARGGVASLMTPKGVELFPIRTGMGDHNCTLATVAGIMAALYTRTMTGSGRLVETSLLRAGSFAVSSDLSIFMRLGRVKATAPRHESAVPLVNFFRSSDDRWFCLMPRDSQTDWPVIATAADRPDLIADPRFTTREARAQHVGPLIEALDAGFGRQEMAPLAARLRAADLVWAPVQSPAELLDDVQARAIGCFEDAIDQRGEPFASVAGPVDFGLAAKPLRVPGLGEHNDAVLAALAQGGWPARQAAGG